MTDLREELINAIIEVNMDGGLSLNECIEGVKSILEESKKNYVSRLATEMFCKW